MSAIGGKADMQVALHMSAFDPKRNSGRENIKRVTTLRDWTTVQWR